jgi:hypothetical protein
MSSPPSRTCAFCGRATTQWLEFRRLECPGCRACGARLGQLLLERPLHLAAVWPFLVEEEDDDPEPKVRLADGRMVELRERTAELKKELSLEARLQLALSYGELGMFREQLLECGFLLVETTDLELAQKAVDVLSAHPPAAADPIEQIRAALFVC